LPLLLSLTTFLCVCVSVCVLAEIVVLIGRKEENLTKNTYRSAWWIIIWRLERKYKCTFR